MSLAASVYAENLSFLKHGRPLWIPEPRGGKEVLIGDVGYIFDGGFYRIFNVTLPHTDPINSKGVPINFEVLPLEINDEELHHVEELIPPGSVLCSRRVRQAQICASAAAGVQPAGGEFKYSFTCKEEQGAVLLLKDHATSKRVHPSDKTFINYMNKHWKEWHEFVSRTKSLDPEQIVFVSGWVKTTEWAMAAFLSAGSANEVLFQAEMGSFAKAKFSVSVSAEHSSSVQHRVGPSSKSPRIGPQEQNQCIFLSYFKLKRSRFFKINFKIIAAAEPEDEDPPSPPEYDEWYDAQSGSGSEGEFSIEAEPPLEVPYDPLDAVLDYVLENSGADVAIASHTSLSAVDWPLDNKLRPVLERLRPQIVVDKVGHTFGMLKAEEGIYTEAKSSNAYLGLGIVKSDERNEDEMSGIELAARSKRNSVLMELLVSERAYASDMALIRDVYMPLALDDSSPTTSLLLPFPPSASSSTLPAAPNSPLMAHTAPMSARDVKIIFGNVPELATFSDAFTERIEEALGSVLEGGIGIDHIGALLLETIPILHLLYSTYFSRYTAAIDHLSHLPQTPSLHTYLTQIWVLSQGMSHNWDLPSLLARPMQRLLWYSSFLNAIDDETPESHEDKGNLKLARAQMDAFMHGLNEEHGRREIVRELLAGPSEMPIGGSSANRKGLNLNIATSISMGLESRQTGSSNVKEGAEAEQEALEVARMGEELQTTKGFVHKFVQDAIRWIDSMTNMSRMLLAWTLQFEETIGTSPGGSDSFVVVVETGVRICLDISNTIHQELIPCLRHLTDSTRGPEHLLEAMRTLEPLHRGLLKFTATDSHPPSQLLKASNSYVALRGQLRAEMPKYLELLRMGVERSLRRFQDVQINFWKQAKDNLGELFDSLRVDEDAVSSAERTVEIWGNCFEEVYARISRLAIVIPIDDMGKGKQRSRDLPIDVTSAHLQSRDTLDNSDIHGSPSKVRGPAGPIAPDLSGSTAVGSPRNTIYSASTASSHTLSPSPGLHFGEHPNKSGKVLSMRSIPSSLSMNRKSDIYTAATRKVLFFSRPSVPERPAKVDDHSSSTHRPLSLLEHNNAATRATIPGYSAFSGPSGEKGADTPTSSSGPFGPDAMSLARAETSSDAMGAITIREEVGRKAHARYSSDGKARGEGKLPMSAGQEVEVEVEVLDDGDAA